MNPPRGILSRSFEAGNFISEWAARRPVKPEIHFPFRAHCGLIAFKRQDLTDKREIFHADRAI